MRVSLVSLPAAVALFAAVAVVVPAPARADAQADAAARAATRAAKRVTVALERAGGSTTGGTVSLQVIGRTRTRVRVQLTNPSGRPLSLAIVRGSDCQDNRLATLASAIPLRAVDASHVSDTVVAVPMSSLTASNYLVQVRDATTRAGITQACAHLAR